MSDLLNDYSTDDREDSLSYETESYSTDETSQPPAPRSAAPVDTENSTDDYGAFHTFARSSYSGSDYDESSDSPDASPRDATEQHVHFDTHAIRQHTASHKHSSHKHSSHKHTGHTVQQHKHHVAIDVDSDDSDDDNMTREQMDDYHRDTAFSERMANKKSEPLSLAWYNISFWVKVKKQQKCILNDITAECKAGELMAIMGASGAGKTSLLNVLSGRAAGTCRGSVRINGKKFTARQFRKVSAYVLQEDLLFPFLTVRETLMYAARLRLASNVPKAEKEALVESLIEELGLVKCSDTIVGNAKTRGISGGEKKRLSIACELIVDPGILFLDEPTSGLDSTTALNLMQTLRTVAASGRTVICTIHQPRSGIYQLVDKLLLLAEGQIAYFGDANKAVKYFASKGLKCPKFTNPADFFLDITAIDTTSERLIAESNENVHELLNQYKEVAPVMVVPETSERLTVVEPSRSGFFTQLGILTQRTAKNVYRDKPRTIFRVLQALFVGIVIGFIFFQLDTDVRAIQDRTGVLFFLMINQAFGSMFSTLNVFLEERTIFTKERQQGYYSVLPYFLSKSIAEFPLTFVPILFGCVVYWIIGLNPAVDRFFVFLLALYLATFVTESLGLAIAAVAPSLEVANALAPLILVFFLVFGGFYLNNENIPVYFVWLRYWSFVGYAYEVLVVNEFKGVIVEGTVEPPAPAIPGEDVLKQFAMNKDFLWYDIIILASMGIAYRIIAYCCLRFMRRGSRSMDQLKPLSSDDTELKQSIKEHRKTA